MTQAISSRGSNDEELHHWCGWIPTPAEVRARRGHGGMQGWTHAGDRLLAAARARSVLEVPRSSRM
eukprot:4763537-Amphidinium_carterae.1